MDLYYHQPHEKQIRCKQMSVLPNTKKEEEIKEEKNRQRKTRKHRAQAHQQREKEEEKKKTKLTPTPRNNHHIRHENLHIQTMDPKLPLVRSPGRVRPNRLLAFPPKHQRHVSVPLIAPRIHHGRQVIRPRIVRVARLAAGAFGDHEAEVASFVLSFSFL